MERYFEGAWLLCDAQFRLPLALALNAPFQEELGVSASPLQ